MEYKVGDKVVFVDKVLHTVNPHAFPALGTIGEIHNVGPNNLKVEWEDTSTGCQSIMWCDKYSVRPCRQKLKAKVYRRDRAGNRIRVREV